jgi:2-methylcitrate dehydratase PrpD
MSGADGGEFDDVIAWASGALPASVARKARLLLLDALGCIAAGLRHAEVQALNRSLAAWFPGSVRLPGSVAPLGPAGVAALGAAAMCWDEANEGLARAHGRPGLAVIPALLGLAEGVTLGVLLRALVVGYEVGGRAGEIWRIRPGMHVDGSWHALGAASACAMLTGGDAARAARIAACQIPFSLYRPLAFGMTGRNSYACHAALLGVISSSAAAAGSDAPPGGLTEARRLALLRDDPAVRAAPGIWLIEEAYIKPFAGVRHAHYGAAAAIEARSRLPDIGAITAIRLEVYGEALRYAANRGPATPIAAQFSLSFGVAAALRFGDLSPDAYRALDDPELRRLEGLVELAEDVSMTFANRRAARLSVTVPQGVVRVEVDSVPGDPGRAMSEAEIEAKFLRMAAEIDGAPAIAERVLRGESDALLLCQSDRS